VKIVFPVLEISTLESKTLDPNNFSPVWEKWFLSRLIGLHNPYVETKFVHIILAMNFKRIVSISEKRHIGDVTVGGGWVVSTSGLMFLVDLKLNHSICFGTASFRYVDHSLVRRHNSGLVSTILSTELTWNDMVDSTVTTSETSQTSRITSNSIGNPYRRTQWNRNGWRHSTGSGLNHHLGISGRAEHCWSDVIR